jgi:hypothetical protein
MPKWKRHPKSSSRCSRPAPGFADPVVWLIGSRAGSDCAACIATALIGPIPWAAAATGASSPAFNISRRVTVFITPPLNGPFGPQMTTSFLHSERRKYNPHQSICDPRHIFRAGGPSRAAGTLPDLRAISRALLLARAKSPMRSSSFREKSRGFLSCGRVTGHPHLTGRLPIQSVRRR